MLPPALTAHVHAQRFKGCSAGQIYSNVAYVAAGLLGTALASTGPMALRRTNQIAARVVLLVVAYLVVGTGIVSIWYHRVGTDHSCPVALQQSVGRVDVACACTTIVTGAGVLLPLAVVGIARRPRAGPILLVVVAGLLGVTAGAVHLRLVHHDAREQQPCMYDVGHAAWHVLGAASAAIGFCAVFLALRP